MKSRKCPAKKKQTKEKTKKQTRKNDKIAKLGRKKGRTWMGCGVTFKYKYYLEKFAFVHPCT